VIASAILFYVALESQAKVLLVDVSDFHLTAHTF
jgi:hypothetical protein